MAYKVLGMIKSTGLDKDMHSGYIVPYKTLRERGEYQVIPVFGILWWKGALLDMGDRSFSYVMDGDGHIYTAPDAEVHHHSAFLAGQPAAAAGIWRVTRGRLTYIDNISGHYMPPGDYGRQILAELQKGGINLDNVRQEFTSTSTEVTARAKARYSPRHLKWWQRNPGPQLVKDYVEATTVNGKPVERGSHYQGQLLRLYPGSKPEWSWF
jgi:hypothetical protein